MGLLDIDEKDIKISPKEERLENKKSSALPIGDSLLDGVNRNTEIIINNPELAKISKNILQNGYNKLEKQLRSYFNIKELSMEVKVPSIENKTNITLSLNTANLLDEQKELVYNSIGTVFADKFDIEFKVRENVGDNLDIADCFETSFVTSDSTRALEILAQKHVSVVSVSSNSVKFRLSTSNYDLALAKEIDNILRKENLYDKQQKYTVQTKWFKETNCSRMARCKMFKSWNRTIYEGRYEPRGGSGDNYATISNAAGDLGLGEKTFFREKLNICIKNYDMLFEKAIKMSNVKNMSKLINEFFDIFNIPNTYVNIQTALDNKSLSSLILRD